MEEIMKNIKLNKPWSIEYKGDFRTKNIDPRKVSWKYEEIGIRNEHQKYVIRTGFVSDEYLRRVVEFREIFSSLRIGGMTHEGLRMRKGCDPNCLQIAMKLSIKQQEGESV